MTEASHETDSIRDREDTTVGDGHGQDGLFVFLFRGRDERRGTRGRRVGEDGRGVRGTHVERIEVLRGLIFCLVVMISRWRG